MYTDNSEARQRTLSAIAEERRAEQMHKIRQNWDNNNLARVGTTATKFLDAGFDEIPQEPVHTEMEQDFHDPDGGYN